MNNNDSIEFRKLASFLIKMRKGKSQGKIKFLIFPSNSELKNQNVYTGRKLFFFSLKKIIFLQRLRFFFSF